MLTAEERAALAALSPAVLPSPPVDLTNKHADDPAAAALGQKIFFAPIFAGRLLDGDNDGSSGTLGMQGDTGKVACASCHLPMTAFSDTRSPSEQISLASGWGKRRAPSLLDVGQAKLIMWDGRRDALYNQVFGPIESPVEMNSSRLYAAEQVFALLKPDYEAVFGNLPTLSDTSHFPALTADETGCAMLDGMNACVGPQTGSPGDKSVFDGMASQDQKAVTEVIVNVGKAIGAYERLLSCGPSRFDAWMHGDATALTAEEQRGAQVFVGPGKCLSCHAGPFLSDEQFHNVGLAPGEVASAFIDADDHGAATGIAQAIADPLNTKGVFSDGDDGRLPASVSPSMEGSFRTPTLRCVSQRPSFMHTGQLRTLEAVVDFFNQGGDGMAFYGTNELMQLGLSDQQKSDLVAFLKALDGPGPSSSLLQP
jgi:cytochrome c peroxidase